MGRNIAPMSATAVKNLKYPLAKKQADGKPLNPVFIAVGGVPGLLLQITQFGSKSWAYRYRLGATRRTMGLGSYDHKGRAGLTLEEARDAAGEARRAVKADKDPLAERAETKAALIKEQEASLTFAQLIDKWEEANPHEYSSGHRLRKLNAVRDLASLQKMDLRKIDVASLRSALQVLMDRGAVDTANRTRQTVAMLLHWAKDSHLYEGENSATDRSLINHISSKLKGVAKGTRFFSPSSLDAAHTQNIPRKPPNDIQQSPRWRK